MTVPVRKDLEAAFTALRGRAPNDSEIKNIYRIRDALGLRDNDALWIVLLSLEYYRGEFEAMLVKNAEASKRSNELSQATAIAISEAEMQKRLTKEAEVIASLAKDVARATAGRSFMQWAIAAAIVALVSLSAAGWLGWYSGHKAGYAEGYAETQDERANASWGNSSQGKKARRLAEAGSLDMLADCSGPGWYKVGDNCMPAKLRKGGKFGWRLGRHQ